MPTSLEHRRDDRTEEVFEHNIEDYSEREHYWSLALRLDFEERGITCEVEDHGVDGSGRLIRDTLPNHNADKKFILEDGREWLIEIKTAPEYLRKFFTFKVFCLEQCIEQGAWVSVPRLAQYYLFKPSCLEQFLNSHEHRIYRGFSPNDVSVRIPMDFINNMIHEHHAMHRTWKPRAKMFVDANQEILTRERKN